MTIALAVKVHEGIVLATDSAATMTVPGGAGAVQVVNVYNNANKLFNLVKGQPIGGMVWGSGSIGTASISTIIKDLRQRMTADPVQPDWHLDLKSYSISDVAHRVKKALEEQIKAFPGDPPTGGFLVSGYSVGGDLAESWLVGMEAGVVKPPVQQFPQPDVAYWTAFGEPESVCRLLNGFSPAGLSTALKVKGVPDADIPAWVDEVRKASSAGLLSPAMPIRDAIDLAEFLAQVAAQFSRFSPQATTVGGPIDVAAVTKHEGFRWIERKYYFKRKYNPQTYN